MPKKTRHRQLRKQATRRMAERRAQQRKKVTAIVVAMLIALGGGTFAFIALRTVGQTAATPTPTPTPPPTGSTPSPSPTASPGTQTGTVTPQAAPKEVACGAKAPAEAGKPKPQFAGPPPTTIDPRKTYTATIETSCGTIVIKLLTDSAPVTVNSFVFLAQHHYFDGQYFHRLDTGLDVIQGGDPSGTGTGGPGYSIPDELTGSETYGPGVVAMAKTSAPNSGGSQFFIITGPKGHLLDPTPNFTVFGTIVSGLDVAQKIQALPIRDPQAAASGDLTGQQPKMAVYIDKVTISVK